MAGGHQDLLARPRLHARLHGVQDGADVVIVAPAGAGKTTLVQQALHDLDHPVLWHPTGGGLRSAARDLSPGGARPIHVIDDVHLVTTSEAERALLSLLSVRPQGSPGVILLSRSEPIVDRFRTHLRPEVVELTGNDLRFRTWEVEDLFRRVLGQNLRPDDVAELARRTDGWAVGLRLFHLATKDLAPRAGREVLRSLTARTAVMQRYLARTVLQGLPDELNDFLHATCVLPVLTPGLCDAIRGTTGSGEILHELVDRQLLMTSLDGGHTWRYHDILRAHLVTAILNRHGEVSVRTGHRRAAGLLEDAGMLAEAVRTYAAGEAHDEVARLLELHGPEVLRWDADVIEVLPAGAGDTDPWHALAHARRLRRAGRWPEAVDAYSRARTLFAGGRGADTCLRERRALALWLEPVRHDDDRLQPLRRATCRDALGQLRRTVDEPAEDSVRAAALIALLLGHPVEAGVLAQVARTDPDADDAEVAIARAIEAVVGVLTLADDHERRFQTAVEAAEAAQLEWLTVLALRGRAAVAGDWSDGARARQMRSGDWGTALASMLRAVTALSADRHADARASAMAALDFLSHLDAGNLRAWCELITALGEPPWPQVPHDAWRAASRRATRAGLVAVPDLIGRVARVPTMWLQQEAAAEQRRIVRAIAGRLGAPLDTTASQAATASAVVPHDDKVTVRCFGGFSILAGGTEVDTTTIRPRARSVLKALVLAGGTPTHQEVLCELFWPGLSPETGRHNLQVALSSVRSLLREHLPSSVVRRQSESYRLDLGGHPDVDAWVVDRAIHLTRARPISDPEVRDAVIRAVDAYTGPLLPEEGPAEWVVPLRERYRTKVINLRAALDHHVGAEGGAQRNA